MKDTLWPTVKDVVHCAYAFAFTYLVAYLMFWLGKSSPVEFLQTFSVAHVCIGSLMPPLPVYQSTLKSSASIHVFVGVLRCLDCSFSAAVGCLYSAFPFSSCSAVDEL